MKVISLWQPWASLVVLGHKKIETRGFKPSLAMQHILKTEGFLIHASKKESHFQTILGSNKELPHGAIIGKVKLVECFQTGENYDGLTKTIAYNDKMFGIYSEDAYDKAVDKEKAFGNYEPNRFGWLLSDPILFDTPIPAKGQQGWWSYDLPSNLL